MNWTIERHACLESTNALALDRARAAMMRCGNIDRLVIIAQQQSAGRGQHGRAWESPAGGLYLSAVVTSVPAALRDKLALIAGAAAAEALQQFMRQTPALARAAGQLQLRWPNDILIAGRKLGGILCEAVAVGPHWAGVIGIGVNVNVALDDLPAPLRPAATSLQAVASAPCDIASVERALLAELGTTLTRIHTAGLALAIDRYRRLDALRGRALCLQVDDAEIIGQAAGISDTGELLLETPAGLRAISAATLISIDGQPLRRE